MEGYIVDWINLLVRWLHVITGVAWIGASFYFIWLDGHLESPQDPADDEKGVGGEVWSVHGGGFYHAQKYKVSPAKIPERLHWFKWEAYTTWMSGIFLTALVYWYGAEVYLIDPAVADVSAPKAVSIAIAFIVGGWLVYDLLCKSPLARDSRVFAGVLFALTGLLAWGLCQVFSGRGAYIHFGAVLGTIMVANVFFVIIPGQKKMVAAAAIARVIRDDQQSLRDGLRSCVQLADPDRHIARRGAHPHLFRCPPQRQRIVSSCRDRHRNYRRNRAGDYTTRTRRHCCRGIFRPGA